MTKWRRFLLGMGAFLIALGHPPLRAQSQAADPLSIRLLVLENAPTLTVEGLDLRVDCLTAPSPPPGQAHLEITAEQGGIRLAGHQSACMTLEIHSPAIFIKMGQREYRSPLRIMQRAGGLFVVNPIPLEIYLRGIVATEMPPSWPEEALKAQAVVARSYAIGRLSQTRDQFFDLYASVKDQAYGGSQMEDHRVVRAVKSTEGQVLERHGRVLETNYHAICGGRTELPHHVWSGGGAFPPSVGCDYCRDAPKFKWQHQVDARELAQALREEGFRPSQVRALSPAKRGTGGRWAAVKITGDGQSITVPGNEFRRIVGYSKLRSLEFTATFSDGQITFRGEGFGHGVGLCQWGARGRAREGQSYRQILSHYYPGAILSTL